jgi:hypothetical protein
MKQGTVLCSITFNETGDGFLLEPSVGTIIMPLEQRIYNPD